MNSGFYWVKVDGVAGFGCGDKEIAYFTGEHWRIIGWDGYFENDKIQVLSERLLGVNHHLGT